MNVHAYIDFGSVTKRSELLGLAVRSKVKKDTVKLSQTQKNAISLDGDKNL